MSIKKRKQAGVWVIGVPIVIYTLFLSVQNIFQTQVPVVDYILFLILAVLISAFPIRTQDSVFTVGNGISLVAFMVFGILPELLLSLVGILALLVRSDIKLDQHYRYPINLIAALTTSIIAATGYHLSNQFFDNGELFPVSIVSMVVYMLSYVLANQALAVVVGKYFYGFKDVPFFDGKLVFSLRTALLVLPLSFILLYLYLELGAFGIIIGAIPFSTTSIMTKYYYKSKSNNMLLTEVTKYSQLLATKKTQMSVIESFMDYILKIFPAKQVFYFKIQKKRFAVLDRLHILDEKSVEQPPEIVVTERSPLMDAINNKKVYVYDKASEWRNSAYNTPVYQPESAIVLPVSIMNKDKGVIVITHHHRAIYDEFLVTLIEIFYQYFRVVLDKAYEHEKLEDSNLTDYLTNLPNLKGFSKYFNELDASSNYETLSLVVLDLDYFKRVNDVHGHEAGNDVLYQVAGILKTFVSEDCFTARFGGEEFILLLRNMTKKEAFRHAEKVRKAIEDHTFKVHYSIDSEKEEDVRITASLGIATYPDDADNIHSLVKLSDRAMYLGSKQSGRNMTTMYNEER